MGVPIVDVAETPVKGTPRFIFIDPTLKVAEIPVKIVVLSDFAVGVPRVDVAEMPEAP